jgi:ABC-type nitrate/sulfonate/bicarbonate transport system permease component
VWPPAAAILALLFIWQLAAEAFGIPGWLLPSPADIAAEAWLQRATVFEHAAATIRLTAVGFAIGSTIGLLFACLLHASSRLKSAFYPLIVLSQNIPTIVLAPLLAIWFGFGLLPKLIVITLVCFFPITISMLNGLTETDPAMRNYMQMIGATKRQLFFKLELPYAIPYLFAGLKISATYSVMGAIVAEWLGTDKGVGMYMILQKSAFRTDRVFIAIAVIVGLSLLLFGLIALLEKWFVRWKPQDRS